MTAGVRPTTMILGADNRKPWSEMDVLVTAAYQRYVDETCQEHGGPIWMCRSDDLRLNVRVKERPACMAAEAVSEYQEKHKDDDDKKVAVPEFYMRGDEEIPLKELRDAYRKSFQPEVEDDLAD